MFPGSRLGPETSRPVPLSDGTTDLYVAPDSFHDIFCQDVPAPQAALMAITQRPATQEALTEPSCDHPLWKDVPLSQAGFHGDLVSRILSSGEETLRGHGTSEEISR
jgi:hypothetical protein